MQKINILLSTILFGLMPFSIVHATKITIVNKDSAGEGFNDTTAVSAVPGNSATTLGKQRLNAFQAAADYWETRLQSSVEIKVNAAMDPLTCSQFSAVLGSAGAEIYIRDFADAPVTNTWFPIALANSYAGSDLDVDNDIGATFNSDLDNNSNCLSNTNWSYAIGVSAPPGEISFYNTVVHEIAHGLGFHTLMGSDGAKLHGLDDNYLTFLRDETANENLSDMATDAERAAAAINTGNLVWTGTKAVAESASLTAGRNSGKPQMYAPNPYDSGSSVSHWDSALIPNEVMEPAATTNNTDDLSVKAFYDMHWGDPCRLTNTIGKNKWHLIGIPCEPPSNANTVKAILADDISGVYDEEWVVYSYDPSVPGYINLGLGGKMTAGKGYWVINVSSGVTLDMPDKSKKISLTNSTQCTSTNDCFESVLSSNGVTEGWHLLASPFRDNFNWSGLRVKINTGTTTCNDSNGCTMAQADAANLVDDDAFAYNPATSAYDSLKNTTLTPWTGMWFTALSGASSASPPKLFFPSQ